MVPLDPARGTTIQLGLSWDFFGDETVDLDATVVLIDDMGTVKDSVFYNKLRSDCGAVTHSGDNRDGI